MIEKTVLNKETIVSLVKKKYGIDITEIYKLNKGSANLYSLNNNKYILKEFQSKYTKDEIEKEIQIINHLKKESLLVPEYIATINNEYSFIYKEKVITMQKFIDGYTIESNTANYSQMIESARLLGQIIKSLESLEIKLPVNDVSSWFSVEKLNESIKNHQKLLEKVSDEKIIDDIKEKIIMLEYAKENFKFDKIENLTIMNTHGDYSVLQFIYKNGKIKAVIDFVSACQMPIVWEIIRSYSYIDADSKDGIINVNNLVEYIKEFCKYIKLNEYDIKYMVYIYLVQLLSSTFGYKQYIEDNSKKELLDFAFFRTKLCKYLFDNAELITSKLEREFIK